MAAAGIANASAAVAAQPIEEKASAKVARRDEVWRRRNWLRLAWVRNQSWIALAQVATMTMPALVMAACQGDASARTATSGARIRGDDGDYRFDLGAQYIGLRIGAVATRSGASSPEMLSHASPPAS